VVMFKIMSRNTHLKINVISRTWKHLKDSKNV